MVACLAYGPGLIPTTSEGSFHDGATESRATEGRQTECRRLNVETPKVEWSEGKMK